MLQGIYWSDRKRNPKKDSETFFNDSFGWKRLRQGKKLTTVAEHYYKEQGKLGGTQLVGLERVSLGMRGGDITRALLLRESRWIFQLGSLILDGLMGNFSFLASFKYMFY